MTLHAQIGDAFDDRGARIIDAVQHRLQTT